VDHAGGDEFRHYVADERAERGLVPGGTQHHPGYLAVRQVSAQP